MRSDRERWNEKFASGSHAHDLPSPLITSIADFLPSAGRALELAGGAGRHAVWLARRGLEVTLLDVSDVALQIARERAQAAQLPLHTVQLDLLHEPLPAGPWDLILGVHFLYRPLLLELSKFVEADGIVVILQPTRRNLERHPRPPAEYLLAEHEITDLLPGFSILHYREDWLEEGRHEALVVARRSSEKAYS